MFTFLRRIRKKLIASGSLTKYIFYAVGEILLVVIGILIALQINNWNEKKKSSEYEATMLNEVDEALVADSLMIERWIPNLKATQRSYNRLAHMKNDPAASRDSLLYHARVIIDYGILIKFNKSPFEAIKSGGLDKISDHEIRKSLSDLYGYEIEITEEWINDVLRVELFERNQIVNQLFQTQAIPEEGGDVLKLVSIADEEQLLKDPRFDILLTKSSWPLSNTIRSLSRIKKDMNLLHMKIEEFLNR